MDWIDVVSEIAIQKHSEKVGVTVSIDRVSFSRSVRVGEIVTLRAQITRTFETSIEVFVEVWVDNLVPSDSDSNELKKIKTNEAFLVFVVVDENGNPCKAPPIKPESAEEKLRYANAMEHRRSKLKGINKFAK